MTEDEELMNKYGKPLRYDRNFQGPRQKNRSCTDVPCLLLFVLFLAGWGFIAHYAIKNGDLNQIMSPTDSFNRKCGLDSGVLGKDNLFFFDLGKCINPSVPLTGCPTPQVSGYHLFPKTNLSIIRSIPQVCVESCPTEDFMWDDMKNKLNFGDLHRRLICQSEELKSGLRDKAQIEDAIRNNLCARSYMKSESFFKRCLSGFPSPGCIPRKFGRLPREVGIMPGNASALVGDLQQEECRKPEDVIKEKMSQANDLLAQLVGNFMSNFYNDTQDAQRMGEEIGEDLINSMNVILWACVCTLIASLIFIALMRWLSGPIMWFSIFGVLIGLLVGLYYSVKEYMFWQKAATGTIHGPNLYATVQSIRQNPKTWLYLSIFVGVCFVVILLLVIVLRKRIRIAIALTKEGSKAVSSVYSTVFFPIFSWVLFIATIVFAVGVGLYLGSIGDPTFRMVRQLTDKGEATNEPCKCEGPAFNYTVGEACIPRIFEQHCNNYGRPCTQTTCSFVSINNPAKIEWAIAYDVFGFLWLSFFISGFSYMVLASTFARWYWTFKKRDVPFFTLTGAFCQTAFYHLGTVAFGSLILAICRMIRIVLEYIDQKLKKYDNAVTKAILCCMRCFFWLLETFLKFLNRNAYIMCAIHGNNFCSSAKDAFNLIMRNFLRVITLDKVTDFLFFLSKLLITAGAGVSTFYFLVHYPPQIPLHYNAVPTTVVVIASFLITSVFFSVYSTAVDTLFLCFLEDCERNDGSQEKPYFMSKQLMKILGKKNKFPPRQQRGK
nr:choline transporter-like 2 [Drosophila bipectinata]XP_043067756.1 choline transporter-like 2 [Drosophila bipectinata]